MVTLADKAKAETWQHQLQQHQQQQSPSQQQQAALQQQQSPLQQPSQPGSEPAEQQEQPPVEEQGHQLQQPLPCCMAPTSSSNPQLGSGSNGGQEVVGRLEPP